MTSQRFRWFALSLGCAVGCAADPSAAEDIELPGAQVASVEVGPAHTVELWQLDDGSTALREVGSSDDPASALPPLATASEQFLALASAHLPPAQLREVRARVAQLPAPAASAPPPAALTPVTRPAGVNGAHDWTADIQWFKDSFCGGGQVDAVWCPTGVASAQTNNVGAMYDETTCNAASFDQGAAYQVERWNGSAWTTLASTTVASRHWQKLVFQVSGLYHASCASIDTGGNSRVDFAHRFRWRTPAITNLASWPNDREFADGVSDNMQGITHDASSWYTTTKDLLWKTPVGTGLALQPTGVVHNPFSALWSHMGDLSYGAGYLFVPLEPGDDGSAPRGGVGMFDTSLHYYGGVVWPLAAHQTDSSWVAYNPSDGLLYSSPFDPTEINKFSWSVVWANNDWQITVTWLGRIPILDGNGNPAQLGHVQGGEFSASGKLYLAGSSAHKIFVLDPNNGRVQTIIPTPAPSEDELEGVTLWDLDNGASPNVAGQIHVQVNDDDISGDDYTLMHFRADDPSKL